MLQMWQTHQKRQLMTTVTLLSLGPNQKAAPRKGMMSRDRELDRQPLNYQGLQ